MIIKIDTQKQFNFINDDFEGEIQIIGNIKRITKYFKKAIINVSGNGQVGSVSGNGQVDHVYGNGQVGYVSGNGQVGSVSGNGQVGSVSGNGQVGSVSGNGQVDHVYGNGQVGYVSENGQVGYVSGNGQVDHVYGNGQVGYVSGNGQVGYVSGNGQVDHVYGNGQVGYVSGNGQVGYVSENGQVRSVYGNGQVRSVSGNGQVIIYSDTVKINKAIQESVILCKDCNPLIKYYSESSSIIYKKIAKHTKESFLEIYSEQINNKKITLYKSVNPKTNCDFYTGKIKYKGVVKPKKWNPDPNIQCGDGLHLSPLPEMAFQYNEGKLLVCEVNIDDFVVHPDDITKVRCKKIKVTGEYK